MLHFPSALKSIPLFLCFLFFLCTAPVLFSQTIISNDTTIPGDYSIEKDGHLTIKAALIVHGNFNMGNKSRLTLEEGAKLIVFGDFIAENMVTLAFNSLIIVYGNFSHTTGSPHGDITAEEGDIYIFGEVDETWDNFDTCGDYEGDTVDVDNVENCDYGTEEDYIDNQDDIQEDYPDINEELNCFQLNPIEDEIICVNGTANFSVNPIPQVSYEWQVKTIEGEWTSIEGESTNSLSISQSDTVFVNLNKFRLVVRATGDQICKVVVSNVATLTLKPVDFEMTEIEGETEICSGIGNLSYEILEIPSVESYNWSVPADWLLESGQNTNKITVKPGNTSGEIKLSATNSCGTTKEKTIFVELHKKGTWTGAMDSNWNNAGNWSCNTIPDKNTNVTIPSGLSIYPLIDAASTGEVKDIEIESGASLILKGKMTIFGNISNSGTFSAEGGAIYMMGEAFQNIPANTFFNNLLKDLLINNPENVELNGSLDISGIVKIEEGNLISNNFLRLISTEDQTALIDGSGNGEIVGNVAMQRYLSPAFGYKYFSSPFVQTLVGNFQDYIDLNSEFPNFYSYNENRKDAAGNDATGWETFTNPASLLEVLKGYALNFGAENTTETVEISGEVNNGPLSIDLQNHGGKYTKGFQLVGNPYPSPIDWDSDAGWTKTYIDDAIYFFTASDSDQYTGTYSSFVNGISSADGKSSNIIPSMQGFFIHVTNPASGIYPVSATLSINNLARVNNFSQKFLKSRKSKEAEISLFSISAGFENEKNDPAIFYFPGFASPSFEKDKDALKMLNTEVAVPNFYSLSPKAEKLSINALFAPEPNSEIHIPLGINSQKEGWMDLKLQQFKNINFYVYLIDKEKKIIQDLSKNDNYRFYSSPGEINSRFELLLSYSKRANSEEIFPKAFSSSVTNGIISVKMNLEKGNSGNLQLTTLSGQILEQFQVKAKETKEFRGIKSSGIYLVSLHYEKGVYTEKIIIRN